MCASVCDCACVLCVVCLCAVCACYLMYPGFIVLFPCCRCSCCRALNVHKLRSLSLLFALCFAFCAACWSCARFRLVLKPAKTPHMCLCRCLSQCVCVSVFGCWLHFCNLQHEKDVACLTLLCCNGGDFRPTAVVCRVSGNEPPYSAPSMQCSRYTAPPYGVQVH